jgi:hypothetical protein
VAQEALELKREGREGGEVSEQVVKTEQHYTYSQCPVFHNFLRQIHNQ